MPQERSAGVIPSSVGDIGPLVTSWTRSLRAANRSDRTIRTYRQAAEGLTRFLAERGMPTQVAAIRREHVEAFIEALLARWKPATANNRFRGLQQLFKWLEDDGEIRSNPMAKMKPPIIPESPPPVLSEDQLRRLLETCDKRTLEGRRDDAILRVFIDTGARLAEVANLGTDDIDLEAGIIRVLGKGRRERFLPIGARTTQTVDRYLRKRGLHPQAALPSLWLGKKGQMTDSGIRQMVWRRSKRAGLPRVHPHQLRHTFAHVWLSAGGGETDLMMLTGWKSRAMLSRYGASAAAERARAAHRKLGLGDRF